MSLLYHRIGYLPITKILREGFTSYRNNAPEGTKRASIEWQDAQWGKIQKILGRNKKLLLFNKRIARNQPQHNSTGSDFDEILQLIRKRNDVAHYTIQYGGGSDAHSSCAFSGAGKEGNELGLLGFNTKVQHLQLLRRIHDELSANNRLLGIYGSTSGTLDAAALLGIRALSLHKVKPKKVDNDGKFIGQLNDQEQREILMAPFKSIALRVNNVDNVVTRFDKWLDGNDENLKFPIPRDILTLKPIFTNIHVRIDNDKEKHESWQRKLKLELKAHLLRCL